VTLIVWPTAGANSYVSVADASAYFALRINSGAWAVNAGMQEAALATATSLLDTYGWVGTPTDPAQPLGWPRTGVGVIDPSVLPPAVVKAVEELALALINTPALADLTGTGSNISSLAAGSARITYFAKITGSIFPPLVWLILTGLTQGSGSSMGGTQVFGDGRSVFSESRDNGDFGMNRGF